MININFIQTTKANTVLRETGIETRARTERASEVNLKIFRKKIRDEAEREIERMQSHCLSKSVEHC